MNDTTEPVELTRAGCLQRLASTTVGRVVFTASAMPAVEPVSYTVHGDEIVFQAVDGSPLAAATRHSVVGFQVDAIDPADRTGWSVLGVGQAHPLAPPDPRAPGPGGARSHTVVLPLQQLTGHRVHLPDPGSVAAA